MGEVRQANEAEIKTAQKGMDSDRIRSQYDEFEAPYGEMVNPLANQQGLNTKEYISMLRAQASCCRGLK